MRKTTTSEISASNQLSSSHRGLPKADGQNALVKACGFYAELEEGKVPPNINQRN